MKPAIEQYLYSALFCHNSPKVLVNDTSVGSVVVEASIEVEPLFGARILLSKTETLCDSIVVVQVSIEVHVKPVFNNIAWWALIYQ